jgi:hypothetical protein
MITVCVPEAKAYVALGLGGAVKSGGLFTNREEVEFDHGF